MEPTTRRHFFYSAGMALTALQATRVMGANERVQIGIIGLGGRGQAHMNELRDAARSPDRRPVRCQPGGARTRPGAGRKGHRQSKPKGYADMREVFADKNVDAVSMPLPNHWHALATIWACQAGKDVYVEKPACHNVYEGQRMIEAARKYKRMVQIGSQSRSMPHKIKAMQLLHEGAIGKVYLAKGLCFKRRKSIGHKPDEPGAARRGLGHVPRPRAHARRSTNCASSTTGTGSGTPATATSATRASTRWISRAGAWASRACRSRVVSTGGKYVYEDDQETPNTQIATFDYGDAELMFEVRGMLYGQRRRLRDRSGGNVVGDLFYGSEGWMAVDGSRFPGLQRREGREGRWTRRPATRTSRTSRIS